MKIYNKVIGVISIGVCVIYFILRVIYEISHIKIIDITTSVISLIVGIVMAVIGFKLLFNEKNKKECIQPLFISAILIITIVIDFLIW